MRIRMSHIAVHAALMLCVLSYSHVANSAEQSFKIVLVAGTVKIADKPGHHDYSGGCKLLASLLKQTDGVETVLVLNGWPDDEKIFAGAHSIVFYTDGGGKQAYLKTSERIALVDKLMQDGVGIVQFHQAVDYPANFTEQATRWIGGTYLHGKSGRGHWPTLHDKFPDHPITRGVNPWKAKDGWLNKIQFAKDMQGITPLVWSSDAHGGSSKGGAADVVGWAYQRPTAGRAFCFTGIDMHQIWQVQGMRQLVVNGILWSAGTPIPKDGAACEISDEQITAFMTPRGKKRKTAS